MDEADYVVMIGAIGDLQLIRPSDAENFGIGITIISPPEHNATLACAMRFLANVDGVVEMALYVRPFESDE